MLLFVHHPALLLLGVHKVELGEHAESANSLWVNLLRALQDVHRGDINVCWDDAEENRALLF